MKKLSILFPFLLFCSACIYSEVKLPLDTDLNETSLGEKVGRSSLQSVAYLFAWGDASTHAAAENGGITVIKHLDAEYNSYFFGLYSKRTTIAYGD